MQSSHKEDFESLDLIAWLMGTKLISLSLFGPVAPVCGLLVQRMDVLRALARNAIWCAYGEALLRDFEDTEVGTNTEIEKTVASFSTEVRNELGSKTHRHIAKWMKFSIRTDDLNPYAKLYDVLNIASREFSRSGKDVLEFGSDALAIYSEFTRLCFELEIPKSYFDSVLSLGDLSAWDYVMMKALGMQRIGKENGYIPFIDHIALLNSSETAKVWWLSVSVRFPDASFRHLTSELNLQPSDSDPDSQPL